MYREVRESIVNVLRVLEVKGLNYGRAGNVSVRIPNVNHVVITPSGFLKSALEPEDLIVIDLSGSLIEGFGKPSVEVPMHLTIYRRFSKVNAVIHAHAPYTTVLAVVRESIPPLLEEMVLRVGGEVRVAEYAPLGTQELAENVVKALEGRLAAIIANHGVVAVGKNLQEAMEVLELVERVAQIYIHAKLLGKVETLPQNVVENLKTLFLKTLTPSSP